MSTPRKARGWDASAHEALLLALLKEVKPTKVMLTSVSEKMKAAGWPYSYDAINQHIQKLRKTRDTSAIQDGASPSAAKTSAAKKPAATRKRATPKKGAKAVQEFKEMYDEDDEQFPFVKNEIYEDDDDIEARSPTLKTKRVKKEHLSAGDDADYGV